MLPFDSSKPVLNIAHRGGAGERPESTLEAFRHALAVGADVLELDVHLTKDNKLLVCHDGDLSRVSGDDLRIADISLEEAQKADAGALWYDEAGHRAFAGRGLRLPSLEELFEELPQALMNVDIKVEDHNAAERVADLIRRFDRSARTVVASFSAPLLRHFRKTAPEITTSAHPGDVRIFYLLSRLGVGRFTGNRVPYLQVPERHGSLRLVTRRFLSAAHNAGRQVHVWTINDPESMDRLLHLGVDGIVTDYPSRLAQIIDSHTKGHDT